MQEGGQGSGQAKLSADGICADGVGVSPPGDEWLQCGQQLLPVHRGQTWTQHSQFPAAHGPLAKESGGNQVQNRKGGGCARSPVGTGCQRKLQVLEVSVILIY